MSLSDWYPVFAGLVAEHGSCAVYAEGLAALGYPPTWADRYSECAIVADSLTRKVL